MSVASLPVIDRVKIVPSLADSYASRRVEMKKIILLSILALVPSTATFGASQGDFVDICRIMRCRWPR